MGMGIRQPRLLKPLDIMHFITASACFTALSLHTRHQFTVVRGRRYGSNTGLLILNKWLLSTYGFKRPVFLTLCHMLACSAMGAAASAARIVPPQPVKSPEQFRKIAGLAVVFCLSVVLGNVALRFIPVSFSQVWCCMFQDLQVADIMSSAVHEQFQDVSEDGSQQQGRLAAVFHRQQYTSDPAMSQGRACSASGPVCLGHVHKRRQNSTYDLYLDALQAIGATTPVFTAVLAVVMMGKRESGLVYTALLPVVIGIVIATGTQMQCQDMWACMRHGHGGPTGLGCSWPSSHDRCVPAGSNQLVMHS